MNKAIGIYIHIPFCKSKCNYCDFNSFPNIEYLVNDYFQAMKREVDRYTEILRNYSISSIFFGGGTPSYISPHYITDFLNYLSSHFKIRDNAEISIEANPGTLSKDSLEMYYKCGINRLSMGVQACQDDILAKLGRIHTVEQFKDNMKLAFDIGFENINTDLIFGIPGQNRQQWLDSLQYIVNIGATHISCYSLTIEEGTPFWEMVNNNEMTPVEDELDRDMYHDAVDYLRKQGYVHYEISNFAKPSYYCKHNLMYWECGEYIGLGAGAHSYFDNIRFSNETNPEKYLSIMMKDREQVVERYFIDEKESMSEYMIMGLRLINGINGKDFYEKFNTNIHEVFGAEIDKLLKRNLLEKQGNIIKLTSKGLDLANQAFIEFI